MPFHAPKNLGLVICKYRSYLLCMYLSLSIYNDRVIKNRGPLRRNNHSIFVYYYCSIRACSVE